MSVMMGGHPLNSLPLSLSDCDRLWCDVRLASLIGSGVVDGENAVSGLVRGVGECFWEWFWEWFGRVIWSSSLR